MAPGDPVPVTRLRGPDHRPVLLGIVVVGTVLGLAVLKPWGGMAGPVPTVLATPGPTPSPAVVAAPSLPARAAASLPARASASAGLAAADRECYQSTAWRLYTSGRTAGMSVRTWYSLRTSAASGPGDRGIPVLRVYGESLDRLGYCAITGATTAPIVGTRAWSVAAGVPVALALSRVAEAAPTDPSAGALFAPPAGSGGGRSRSWPAGRYIFAIDRAGGAAGDWFAVEIVLVH